jgi:hypothetical protein
MKLISDRAWKYRYYHILVLEVSNFCTENVKGCFSEWGDKSTLSEHNLLL